MTDVYYDRKQILEAVPGSFIKYGCVYGPKGNLIGKLLEETKQ